MPEVKELAEKLIFSAKLFYGEGSPLGRLDNEGAEYLARIVLEYVEEREERCKRMERLKPLPVGCRFESWAFGG